MLYRVRNPEPEPPGKHSGKEKLNKVWGRESWRETQRGREEWDTDTEQQGRLDTLIFLFHLSRYLLLKCNTMTEITFINGGLALALSCRLFFAFDWLNLYKHIHGCIENCVCVLSF